LRGGVFGAASGPGWGGQHPHGGQHAGEQFVPAGSGAQDELPGVADQRGGDGDEPVAQGGDHGLTVAGAVPGKQAALDRWYTTDQVENFARVAQAAVESFYHEYAGTRKRTAPAFFAEKIVPAGHARRLMRLLYPRARQIFLFRDPGDYLASVLAFFRKDRRRFETDEQYFDVICTRMLPLAQKWKRTLRYSTLVLYEDLPGQCPDPGKAVAAGHPTGAIHHPSRHRSRYHRPGREWHLLRKVPEW
jgi:hypothetical protein